MNNPVDHKATSYAIFFGGLLILSKATQHAGSSYYQATSYAEYALGYPPESVTNRALGITTAATCAAFTILCKSYYYSVFIEKTKKDKRAQPLMVVLTFFAIASTLCVSWGGVSSFINDSAVWALVSLLPTMSSLILFRSINKDIAEDNITKVVKLFKTNMLCDNAIAIPATILALWGPVWLAIFNYDVTMFTFNKVDGYLLEEGFDGINTLNIVTACVFSLSRCVVDILTKSYATYELLQDIGKVWRGEKKINFRSRAMFVLPFIVLMAMYETVATDCGLTTAFVRTFFPERLSYGGTDGAYIAGYFLSLPTVLSHVSFSLVVGCYSALSMLGAIKDNTHQEVPVLPGLNTRTLGPDQQLSTSSLLGNSLYTRGEGSRVDLSPYMDEGASRRTPEHLFVTIAHDVSSTDGGTPSSPS